MSGLAVIFNQDGAPVCPHALEAMAVRARDRGPHGMRFQLEGQIGFAHLALKTTPEAFHESQPLVSTDGQIVLAADARIDNRPELLRELAADLRKAETVTDIDLILAAYRKWGADCSSHLIGDFAFVVWDAPERRLVAACDPLGVRKLHYATFGEALCIATEAQQIFGHPAAVRRVNQLGLANFIAGVNDPKVTVFEGVHGLPGGHRLIATPRAIRLDRYWNPAPGPRLRKGRVEDHAEQLIEVLDRCVSDRLRTGRRAVGTMMSGGMDSTTVTALAHRALSGSSVGHRAYTYQFKTLPECDESAIASTIGAFRGLDLELLDAEAFWYLDDLNQRPAPLETPYRAFDTLDEFLLGHLADRGGDVLLTGHGGDQMMGVTRRDQILDGIARWDPRVIKALKSHRTEHGLDSRHVLREFVVPGLFGPAAVGTIRRVMRRPQTRPRLPAWLTPSAVRLLTEEQTLNTAAIGNARCLPSQRTCMANTQVAASLHAFDSIASRFGVEVRHPFFDIRLLEFRWQTPVELLRSDGLDKWLLRRSTETLLPDAVRWRRGFSSMANYYLRALHRQRESILRILDGGRLEALGLVDGGSLIQEFGAFFRHQTETIEVPLIMALKAESWLQSHFPESVPSLVTRKVASAC